MARTATTAGRGQQVVTGVGAVALLAVIAALPPALLWAAGNPLAELGSWIATLTEDPRAAISQAWQALSARDDGDLFLRALALVGWVAALLAAWAWVTFLVAVLAEAAAQVQGLRKGRVPRHVTRIPGMRLQQQAAAALVAAIVGAFAAPALASAAVPSVVVQPVAVGAAQLTSDRITPPVAQPSKATTEDYLEHLVERGESLLAIAERYNVPWQRLAEANHGLPQPDGRSLQPGKTRVYAGWTLRIPLSVAPTATITSTQAAPAGTAGSVTYSVARGDWLSGVAQRFLGDADRYGEIAALNPQLERRDDRFPDHIEPGWHIRLPEDARDRGPVEHAQGRVVGDRTPTDPGGPAGDSRTPNGDRGSDPAETGGPRPGDAPSPTAAPTSPPAAPTRPSASASTPTDNRTATTRPTDQPATADEEPAGTQPEGESDGNEGILLGALASAGLLSALLLAAVMRQRRRQRQHRQPGHRLPHPRGGATERALRVAEQPADVDRLDLALRSLAAALAEREEPLPDIAAAWIVDQNVTVVLTEPAPQPPAPWIGDHRHWTLPGDATVPPVNEQLAPLPALVAVGSQPGRHLLLDLERLGSLTIAGDSERTLALLRYVACELACNAWSDEVEIVLTGFPARETELLTALNPDRVRAASSITEAVSRLRRRRTAVTAALSASGVADALAGRISDNGEAWAPQVLLVADPDVDDLELLDELGRELRDAGRCAVAVATTTRVHAATGPNTAVIDEDGMLQLALPFLLVEGAAAGLPVRELEPLVEIMAQARNATYEPTPPAAELEHWTEGTDAAGSVLELFTATETAGQAAPAAPEDADRDVPDASAPADPITAVPRFGSGRALSSAPGREINAAIRQRRRQSDPELDSDLRAWREQDETRPRIAVLGPVSVDAPGPAPAQRRRFHAELIVYLAQRGARGASADQLTDALWPDQQVKDASRRVAITRARRWLGEKPDGTAWLPEMGSDRLYRIEPGYLLDWHLFRRLRSRGQSRGPAGVKDLRAALELVRGAPLDGADRAYASGTRNPFTWLPESDIYPGHITSAIVDTAHDLAQLYLEAGDTANARWAVQQAWLADPDRADDEPWRDIMRAAHAEGHAAELRNLLGELMRAREAEVPEDLAPTTYALLRELLPAVLAATSASGSTGRATN
ncbi:LysM peptidoglycan-binding domain-containing protein [Micromonospora tulbaghiae]|uniref:LysM peptidoglycan-binding domain-containing protein n=1 Tax=Micromonospora tulbaghiae TaxID=479978 RepID=UPI0036A77551